MKFHRNEPDAPEINLIPFIDILLVVLIFLVLTTSFQRHTGLAITLPVAEQQAREQRPERIQVALNAQGEMRVNGQAFQGRSLMDLREVLATLAPEGSDTVVVIHADAQAAHQHVVDIMTAARMAGLSKIVFAAQLRQQ